MGWFGLALIAAVALAVTWLLKLPRALTGFVGAAIMLGATGYAVQGSPALPASSARSAEAADGLDDDLTELRQQLFGRFQYSDSYFFISDALIRSGDERAAARAMLGGVRSAPDSLQLWTGLGFATAGADGAMSPMAQMAFRRAHAINSDHPGPWFFEGLAFLRAGELRAARPRWARALALSGTDASYREGIAQRLALLDQVLAIVPPEAQ